MSGYEGEGTGVEQDGPGGGGPDPDMAAGSGWGGSVGGNPGGKPGENAQAQAQSQQNMESLGARADKGGFSNQELADGGIAVNGLNPMNAGQTEEQMAMAQRAGGLIGSVAPAVMGAMAPGFGMVMGAARTGQNLMNGMPVSDVVGGYAANYANGLINKATGGAYGQLQMVGGLAKSLGADVPSMNIGKELVGAAGMGPSGKSYGGAQAAAPATSAGDFVARGLDSEGWAKRTEGEMA